MKPSAYDTAVSRNGVMMCTPHYDTCCIRKRSCFIVGIGIDLRCCVDGYGWLLSRVRCAYVCANFLYVLLDRAFQQTKMIVTLHLPSGFVC